VVDDGGDATGAEWRGGCGRGEQVVKVGSGSGAGARRKKRKGRKDSEEKDFI
jgi:hypothetical protein